MIPKKKLDWWIELTQKERCDIIKAAYKAMEEWREE